MLTEMIRSCDSRSKTGDYIIIQSQLIHIFSGCISLSPSFGFEATSRLPWRPGVEAWVPLARRSRMNNWKAGGMGMDDGYGEARCWNFRMFLRWFG
jgi:hypothetical protein